ncbi:MAG: hypothetical protein ACERKD_05980 [Prolixibacteraceae bacterium]
MKTIIEDQTITANVIPGIYKKEWVQDEMNYKYTCKKCGQSFNENHKRCLAVCPLCNDVAFFEELVSLQEKQKTIIYQHCPICGKKFETSEYLNNVFKDEHVRWLANMVTHYRHEHLKSWDKTWSRGSYGWNQLSEWTYDQEKLKVNERAKRQILRKCKDFMIKNGFTVEHVMKLKNTDSKTIELYKKILDNKFDVA